uniref:FG-GAP-like repeat-containing protein n=1 Tax=Algoriphagus sp. TaxID=1872435 RepID=UPI0040487B62
MKIFNLFEMLNQLKFTVFLLTLLFFYKANSFGQSLIKIGPSNLKLGSSTKNLTSPFFKVDAFGWMDVEIDEKHDAFYYPNFDNYNAAGYFNLDTHNACVGDFNGDGLQDLFITWATFPHTIERESRLTFTVLLNKGDGSLIYSPEVFENNISPERFFAYRTHVADFNNDGKDDVIASSMGMIKRNIDQTYTTKFEPIPLLLSTPNGKLKDATANIEGQENGGLPQNFSFGHDLSVGDVNGDSFPDFYTGKTLFINDGKGFFKNLSSVIPKEINPGQYYIMSSLITDLNNDGIGDIVATYPSNSDKSGYIWLSQNGDSSFSNRKIIELPVGRYGKNNTLFNYAIDYDINNDGLKDIVFSITRQNPYYIGRSLQILVNKGNGVFIDETKDFITIPEYLDKDHGEGSLRVVDVNADGVLDLVHTGGSGQDINLHSSVIYVNKNNKLVLMEPNKLAWVQPWQIEGFEWMEPYSNKTPLKSGYPINLDGKNGIDFIGVVARPLTSWPQIETNKYTFYSILSTSLSSLIDKTAPTIKVKPDVTVKLGSNGSVTISAQSVDNGSNDDEGITQMTLSKATFTCADLGANKVTFTAIDASGNTSSAEVTVTVVDETKPTLKAKSTYTIKLDAEGKATLKWEDLDEGSSDNCDIIQRTLSKTDFSRADGGDNKVTYTITDASGNTSSTEITVRVDIVLSTPERSNEGKGIKAYPNPVSDYLHLEFAEGISIRAILGSSLVDASGRVLGEIQLEESGAGQLGFSTKDLKAGMYFLKLSTRDTLHLIKFNVIH